MKDNSAFLEALNQIAHDKGISPEVLLDALANALVAAYKRLPTAAEEAVVTIDPETGDIRVYGQELDENGDVVREWDDTPDDFGRIVAMTAKQVMQQRIRNGRRRSPSGSRRRGEGPGAGSRPLTQGEPSALMVVPVLAGLAVLVLLGVHPPGELPPDHPGPRHNWGAP